MEWKPGELIVHPVTEDKLVGFDRFGRFMVGRREGEFTSYTIMHDVRQSTCSICQRGWELTSESIGDQEFWRPIGEPVHLSCLARYHGFNHREEIFHALVGARVRFSGLRTIPNGYWGPTDRWGRWMPWYETDLLDHPVMFRIGRRKRVWSIEARPRDGRTLLSWWKDAQEKFSGEDVTKEFAESGVLLHAWSTEKLNDYVQRIAEVGGLQVRRDG